MTNTFFDLSSTLQQNRRIHRDTNPCGVHSDFSVTPETFGGRDRFDTAPRVATGSYQPHAGAGVWLTLGLTYDAAHRGQAPRSGERAAIAPVTRVPSQARSLHVTHVTRGALRADSPPPLHSLAARAAGGSAQTRPRRRRRDARDLYDALSATHSAGAAATEVTGSLCAR